MIFRLFSSGAEDVPPPESALCQALRSAGAKVDINSDGEPVSIELDHAADDQTLSRIRQCDKLEQLTLNWCYDLTDDQLKPLAALPALQRLCLPGATVTGEFLSAFADHPALEWLDLDGSGIEDQSLRRIGRISRLTSLFLRYTNIGDKAVLNLEDAQCLEILHLDGTRTTGQSLPSLRKLKKLQVLSLSAGIRGEDLQALAGSGRLRWLWLSDSLVDDESVQQLRETLNPACSIGWRRRKS